MTEGSDLTGDLLQRALASHQRGELDQARVLYEALLTHQPHHADALHLLGVTHIQSRQHAQALALIDQVLAQRPDLIAAHFSRGLALKALGQLDGAQAAFAAALALQPDYPQALQQRGVVLQAMGRPQEALPCFEQLALAAPKDADAQANLGVLQFELGRWTQAEAAFRQALGLQPDKGVHHFNLATVLQEQGRLEEALSSYDQALARQPELTSAYANRGNVLKDLRRYAAALASLSEAIAREPDALTYSNRGNVHKAMLSLPAALQDYDAALRLQPDLADAHLNKALVLLLMGEFDAGWREYEWRWKTQASQALLRDFSQPLWLGDADVQGQTILLHAEQGLGDTLQFCRYASDLAQRGAKVVMEVPGALWSVIQSAPGVSQWVRKGTPLPPFDLHCPLLSLPLACRTTAQTIPMATAPYLRADPDKAKIWAQRLGTARTLRVGLVWRGSPTHTNDRNRSMPLAALLRHLPPGPSYFSLQKELSASDATLLKSCEAVQHVGDKFDDFADTAAVCSLMDVVLTVDTSVAHLSAALGRPTWVMLPYSPDWRWLLHRTDSPWYAAMRLYRQDADLSWDAVLQRVAGDLGNY